MKKDLVVQGFFILGIGLALTMGCLEREPAVLYFISRFGLSYYEGTIAGATFAIIGLITFIAGLSISSKKTIPPVSIQTQATPSKPSEALAICPKCKARISAKSKFCPECGEDLRPKTDKPSQP